jgi:hypothetical protein
VTKPDKKRDIIAIAISVLIHVVIILLLIFNLINITDFGGKEEKAIPEMVVLFPENKPKEVVENQNANNEVPDQSDLLSEQNSRARNEQLMAMQRNQPSSRGNVPIPNLSPMPSKGENTDQSITQHNPGSDFNRWDIIKGEGEKQNNREAAAGNQALAQNAGPRKSFGINNTLKQDEYSANETGIISLSTYRWEWASYINAMKTRLYEVWRTPPAYDVLGMIYGNTMMRVAIDRNGNMLSSTVLEHNGHPSLQESSENAIENMFPLPRLPVNFPDDSLVITLNLIYPNLRPRSN